MNRYTTRHGVAKLVYVPDVIQSKRERKAESIQNQNCHIIESYQFTVVTARKRR